MWACCGVLLLYKGTHPPRLSPRHISSKDFLAFLFFFLFSRQTQRTHSFIHFPGCLKENHSFFNYPLLNILPAEAFPSFLSF